MVHGTADGTGLSFLQFPGKQSGLGIQKQLFLLPVPGSHFLLFRGCLPVSLPGLFKFLPGFLPPGRILQKPGSGFLRLLRPLLFPLQDQPFCIGIPDSFPLFFINALLFHIFFSKGTYPGAVLSQSPGLFPGMLKMLCLFQEPGEPLLCLLRKVAQPHFPLPDILQLLPLLFPCPRFPFRLSDTEGKLPQKGLRTLQFLSRSPDIPLDIFQEVCLFLQLAVSFLRPPKHLIPVGQFLFLSEPLFYGKGQFLLFFLVFPYLFLFRLLGAAILFHSLALLPEVLSVLPESAAPVFQTLFLLGGRIQSLITFLLSLQRLPQGLPAPCGLFPVPALRVYLLQVPLLRFPLFLQAVKKRQILLLLPDPGLQLPALAPVLLRLQVGFLSPEQFRLQKLPLPPVFLQAPALLSHTPDAVQKPVLSPDLSLQFFQRAVHGLQLLPVLPAEFPKQLHAFPYPALKFLLPHPFQFPGHAPASLADNAVHILQDAPLQFVVLLLLPPYLLL